MSLIHRSTIQLLRFHFSVFLLPVYLFAISEVPQPDLGSSVLIFFILHVLVYPASNGYNSYMDRDITPIGALAHPLLPTRQLFYLTVIMDVLAVALSLFVSVVFMLGIILYISASRAYSYRGIRLKQYAITGFLTVFFFQGALVFFISYHGSGYRNTLDVPLLPMIISSCLIGALYPLTQVYQHEADKSDGIRTISMLVGKRGSFIFSMCLFLLATILILNRFYEEQKVNHFYLYLLFMLPVVLFFLYWMRKVWLKPLTADYKNSLRMNVISTICTSAFFITLIVINH